MDSSTGDPTRDPSPKQHLGEPSVDDTQEGLDASSDSVVLTVDASAIAPETSLMANDDDALASAEAGLLLLPRDEHDEDAALSAEPRNARARHVDGSLAEPDDASDEEKVDGSLAEPNDASEEKVDGSLTEAPSTVRAVRTETDDANEEEEVDGVLTEAPSTVRAVRSETGDANEEEDDDGVLTEAPSTVRAVRSETDDASDEERPGVFTEPLTRRARRSESNDASDEDDEGADAEPSARKARRSESDDASDEDEDAGAGRPDADADAEGDSPSPQRDAWAEDETEGGPPPNKPGGGKGKALGDSLDEQSALGIYFREMAAVQVMTPAQEHAAAEEILRARQKLWRAMLSYAPFVPAIIMVVENTFATEGQPREELRSIVNTSRRYRDRQTRANEASFEQDADRLSIAMARLDTDSEAAEPITADLEAIGHGKRENLVLQVTLPPAGSVPFRRFVDTVRRANDSLWRAKDKFVRANLRLVVTMARRYNRGQLPLPDLIQEGNIGLMKAVDRFDPDRGFRFSTYASWWIRHAISRALADKGREVRVPVHMIDVYHKLKRTRQRFSTMKGREPTDEELAAEAEVPIDKIQRLRQCLLDAGPSLDSPVAGAEGRTVGELLEDESTPLPAEFLQARAMGDKVRELLSRLRPIEADVLRKRFGLDEGEPMTLREIGEQYSLSRERIRQLQEQALGKIRRELRRQDLI